MSPRALITGASSGSESVAELSASQPLAMLVNKARVAHFSILGELIQNTTTGGPR